VDSRPLGDDTPHQRNIHPGRLASSHPPPSLSPYGPLRDTVPFCGSWHISCISVYNNITGSHNYTTPIFCAGRAGKYTRWRNATNKLGTTCVSYNCPASRPPQHESDTHPLIASDIGRLTFAAVPTARVTVPDYARRHSSVPQELLLGTL